MKWWKKLIMRGAKLCDREKGSLGVEVVYGSCDFNKVITFKMCLLSKRQKCPFGVRSLCQIVSWAFPTPLSYVSQFEVEETSTSTRRFTHYYLSVN